MDLGKLLGYLDYGVLGLSAIILIFSFVLLSREQARDEFRPEVALAIRRYMRMALVFAGVALLGMILESVLIRPAKADKEKLRELERMVDELALREVDEQYQIHTRPFSQDSLGVPDSIGVDDYSNLKSAVFASLGKYGGNEKIFNQVMDSMIIRHPELREHEDKIREEHKGIKQARIDWLENKAIPKLEENKSRDSIIPIEVELPAGFNQTTKEVKYIHPSDYDDLKKELNTLKK